VEVEIARDVVDYAEAAGVLVSLVLAAGALIYAKKSSDAASGSARAAEVTASAATQEAEQTRELLRLAADQHERLVRESSRRPRIAAPSLEFQATVDPGELTLGQIAAMRHPLHELGQEIRLWPVVVRASFENIGDKAADQTLARFLVPTAVGLWPSGPRGEHVEDVDLHRDALALRAGGTESAAHAHAWRIRHFPPGQPEALHVLLVFPEPGDYEAELQTQHPDAEPMSRRFLISVPGNGPARVEATQLSTEPYEHGPAD
jgi:hypothetical protein